MRADEPTRLARRLGLADAVVIGVGAMLGAGVFTAFAPAAEAAGAGLLIGLAVAAVVAYCNATSSARLAALYPESGGTYVYGRRRLGPFAGYVAGWSFVAGKLASCTAIALTFGAYVAPGQARPLAVGAVVALTAVNLLGVAKTAALTKVIVALVLASLAAFVVGALAGGTVEAERLDGAADASPLDILQSAGLLFFAFAGYARIATLGEEVIEPRRTIPRAIPIALAVVLVVYGAVALVAVLAASPALLAATDAPLRAVLAAGDSSGVEPVVAAGAAVASLGVLLSLLVGVSRTAFAMASEGDMPRPLAAVHGDRRVPHVAEIAVGAIVAVIAATADLRGAIGFSSFCVLVYYAIANLSALTLRSSRVGSVLAVGGLAGCLLLAFTLPTRSLVGGAIVVGAGVAVFGLRALLRRAR